MNNHYLLKLLSIELFEDGLLRGQFLTWSEKPIIKGNEMSNSAFVGTGRVLGNNFRCS